MFEIILSTCMLASFLCTVDLKASRDLLSPRIMDDQRWLCLLHIVLATLPEATSTWQANLNHQPECGVIQTCCKAQAALEKTLPVLIVEQSKQ